MRIQSLLLRACGALVMCGGMYYGVQQCRASEAQSVQVGAAARERSGAEVPLVVNTWAFTSATQAAWQTLVEGRSVVDAVETGCSTCERLQCDFSVGYGGHPDETGETTLDALIGDMTRGQHRVGAVGGLRRVKSAISVARHVMDYSQHTLLVGELATQFALQMGFKEESLQTTASQQVWRQWADNKCQPNFWQQVQPDPTKSCGPYKPADSGAVAASQRRSGIYDTIGMIAIGGVDDVAIGVSSNGANHKIAGRVGDAAQIGSGAYAEGDVGACVATGDGDVMARFAPCRAVVSLLEMGFAPQQAAELTMRKIVRNYPTVSGALLAATVDGRIGAACHGMTTFPYSVATARHPTVTVFNHTCISADAPRHANL